MKLFIYQGKAQTSNDPRIQLKVIKQAMSVSIAESFNWLLQSNASLYTSVGWVCKDMEPDGGISLEHQSCFLLILYS